jgi:NAD(P)H dehydrogenase (quinone)
MNVMVILCHPTAGSYNHEIAARIVRGLEALEAKILFHDLYRESFDPVLSEEEIRRRFSFDEVVRGYAREAEEADGYAFVHPDWWGMPPALLKGWLDRVFRPGVAYDYEGEEFTRKQRIPLLSGRRALVVATTDRSETEFGAEHPLEVVWRDAVFGFCGITDFSIRIIHNLRDTTLRIRREWLSQIEKQSRSFFSRENPKM